MLRGLFASHGRSVQPDFRLMDEVKHLRAKMANGGLSIAEQRKDRQVRTELFPGRQVQMVTGRVVLHALDDRGKPLCGRDPRQLTATGLAWNGGYLPHLPRCCSWPTQLLIWPPRRAQPALGRPMLSGWPSARTASWSPVIGPSGR